MGAFQRIVHPFLHCHSNYVYPIWPCHYLLSERHGTSVHSTKVALKIKSLYYSSRSKFIQTLKRKFKLVVPKLPQFQSLATVSTLGYRHCIIFGESKSASVLRTLALPQHHSPKLQHHYQKWCSTAMYKHAAVFNRIGFSLNCLFHSQNEQTKKVETT